MIKQSNKLENINQTFIKINPLSPMKLRSAVITTNPRSYEATLDEFPDLFPAFQKPDIQFATSLYHALKSIKFPKKTNIWFSRCRKTSSFQVLFMHTFGKITLTQVDIFLRKLDNFLITYIRTLKAG